VLYNARLIKPREVGRYHGSRVNARLLA
jgi:hypothetical protein